MIVSLAGNQLFSKTSCAHLSLESIQPHLFQSKNFQVDLLLQTSFEWVHHVGIMRVAVLSGCVGGVYMCVCACVCLILMLALFLSLKQPFTGMSTQAKSQFGSPEEQLSTVMELPSQFCTTRKK